MTGPGVAPGPVAIRPEGITGAVVTGAVTAGGQSPCEGRGLCQSRDMSRSVRTLSRRAITLGALGAVTMAVVEGSTGDGVAAPARSSAAARSSSSAGPRSAAAAGSGSSAAGADVAPARATRVGPDPGDVSRPQLPRGGRELFPAYRLVGYSGGPGSAAFGRLGVGHLDDRVVEIEQLGAHYAAGRRPMPVLELIAVVAQSHPGPDGSYRVRIGPEVIRSYLEAARRHRAMLLLNIQPGRAHFLDEVRALESWLREPDVGLALDPEWAVRSGQVPGRVFGRTTGAEIDTVAGYLSRLGSDLDLPEKALVVHQLSPDIIRGISAVRARPGVQVIKSVDGIGPPAAKVSTWRRLVADLPAAVRPGFKLFLSEDAAGHSRLMTPTEVLALHPTPEYVLYE